MSDETPQDATQPDTAADTAAADIAVDSEHTTGDTTFDRQYVEKLRKEAASYRDRAHSAEARVSTLQKATAEQLIALHGLKADAVWAVATLDDLLGDDGAVDPAKVKAAVGAAKDKLGIPTKPAPQGLAGMRSGSMAAQPPRDSWREAFTAPHKR